MPRLRGGNTSSSSASGIDAAEPAEAREKDELQLSHDGSRDAQEEVVEAAVLEVVLDPGSADPAHATVDQDDLSVVDVPEACQIPAGRPAAAERPDRHSRLRGADDADLNAGGREPVVVLACAAFGVGALPVDDEPYGDALRTLRTKTSAKSSPTTPGRKPNWLMWIEDEADAMSSSIGG